jgi:trk system potassium uptake protein TrkA
MILGGTQIGARVAAILSGERGMRVKLIESDRPVAEDLAAELPGVLVIHGEGSDVDLLATEGIMDMDAFIAVKNDEASNLVTCLIAKHLGVNKTVALLSTAAYLPISQRIGIDSAVNKKRSVAAEVLRFLRGKHVLSLATVPGLDVEVLELEASERSRISKGPLAEIKMPDGILIGAVVRTSDVEVATGSTQVRAGDRVIVFALPSMIGAVEKLFNGRRK